jgi:hypothetical protein
MIGRRLIPEVFLVAMDPGCEMPTHRTLRDGLLGVGLPRHFVPGYDRTVPPGHFATGSGWPSLAELSVERSDFIERGIYTGNKPG